MTTKQFQDVLKQLNNSEPCNHDDIRESLKTRTNARVCVGHSGKRPTMPEWLQFRVDHAAARDSIYKQADLAQSILSDCLHIKSLARHKEEYLLRPDLGRKVDPNAIASLQQSGYLNQEVLLLVGDGLSAYAIEENINDILPSIHTGLSIHQLTASKPIFIQYARVGIMDHLGELLHPQTVIFLIGERPGLKTAKSMSAYLCFQPNQNTIESDRDVISNIHVDGLAPVEAGVVIADRIAEYFKHQSSGMNLRDKLK